MLRVFLDVIPNKQILLKWTLNFLTETQILFGGSSIYCPCDEDALIVVSDVVWFKLLKSWKRLQYCLYSNM